MLQYSARSAIIGNITLKAAHNRVTHAAFQNAKQKAVEHTGRDTRRQWTWKRPVSLTAFQRALVPQK